MPVKKLKGTRVTRLMPRLPRPVRVKNLKSSSCAIRRTSMIVMQCALSLHKLVLLGARTADHLCAMAFLDKSSMAVGSSDLENVRSQTRPLRHLNLPKSIVGPHGALFSFCFRGGLGAGAALRRLPKRAKSVSERHLSPIDRPRPPEGRFKNSVQLPRLGDFERAPFSKVQPIAQWIENPRVGGSIPPSGVICPTKSMTSTSTKRPMRVFFKNTPNTHFLPCFGDGQCVESLW